MAANCSLLIDSECLSASMVGLEGALSHEDGDSRRKGHADRGIDGSVGIIRTRPIAIRWNLRRSVAGIGCEAARLGRTGRITHWPRLPVCKRRPRAANDP